MDPIFLTSRIITNGDKIPTYNVQVELPKDWLLTVLRLQKLYLDNNVGGSLRDFVTTLQMLESIAISNNLIDSNFLDLLCWSATSFTNLYILLINSQITEIYGLQPDMNILIHHREHGRCQTNIIYTDEIFETIKNRVELESNKVLTPLTPSIKIGLNTNLGNLRIEIQIPPLTTQPSFIIRRLPIKSITIEQLIEEGQISIDKANFLRDVVNKRKNIVIAGIPGSGKTTLANSLLITLPSDSRLLLFEDAKEISISKEEFPFSQSFHLPSTGDKSLRLLEISKILHRSPDYVFLGELQTKEDTVSCFEAFSAGINGMVTTHCRTLDELLIRWKSSHNLHENLIQVIDIIVITKKIYVDQLALLRIDSIWINQGQKFELLN